MDSKWQEVWKVISDEPVLKIVRFTSVNGIKYVKVMC